MHRSIVAIIRFRYSEYLLLGSTDDYIWGHTLLSQTTPVSTVPVWGSGYSLFPNYER